MREGRPHLAESCHSREMHELHLKLLNAFLSRLPFRKIANEAGKMAAAIGSHFADGQFHWERRAVHALPHHHATDSDDALLARAEVTSEITIVLLAVGSRHQHLDVLSENFRLAAAEQPLSGAAHGFDMAVLIDDDHRVRHSLEDGT